MSSTSSCSGSVQISSSSDASAISSCSTFDGDVTISPYAIGTIDLGDVGSITGDLNCSNAGQLLAINAAQLTTIGGQFSLQTLNLLTTLWLPSLTAVNHIQWNELRLFDNLTANANISRVNSLYIANTSLSDTYGINLAAVGSLDINNNAGLKLVDMSNLKDITTSASITNNGLLDLRFPNLVSAPSLNFSRLTSTDLSSLAGVSSDLVFSDDYEQTISLPMLTTVGRTFQLSGMYWLETLDVPVLKTIGGDLIMDGAKVMNSTEFNALTKVSGDMDLSGNFTSLSFPQLQSVGGDVSILSGNAESNSTDLQGKNLCQPLQMLKDDGAITGSFACVLPAPTTNSGHSSGLSTGAIAGIAVAAAVILAAIVAFFFLRRRKKARAAKATKVSNEKPQTVQAQPLAGSQNEKMNTNVTSNKINELDSRTHTDIQSQRTGGPSSYYPSYPSDHTKLDMAGNPQVAELTGDHYYSYNATGSDQHDTPHYYGGSGGPTTATGTSTTAADETYAPANTYHNSGSVIGSEATPVMSYGGAGKPMTEVGDYEHHGAGAPVTEAPYSRGPSMRIPDPSSNAQGNFNAGSGAPTNFDPRRPTGPHYDSVM